MLFTPIPGPAFEPRLPPIATADTPRSLEVPVHRLLSFGFDVGRGQNEVVCEDRVTWLLGIGSDTSLDE